MTPGAYLRKRREAMGLSIGDVMAMLGGGGLLSAPLEDVEADHEEPTGFDVALLAWTMPIDDIIVARLKRGEPVQICETCGCSLGFECERGDHGKCWLPTTGTCSSCQLAARESGRRAA